MTTRAKRWFLVAVALVSSQACTSAGYIAPFLRESELESDSSFAGVWLVQPDSGPPTTDTVRIELGPDHLYDVDAIFDDSRNKWSHTARLGRFEGRRLFEFEAALPDGGDVDDFGYFLPMRFFFIVDSVSASRILLRYLDTVKLQTTLKAEPGLTPHLKTEEVDVLLTGDTDELRRFMGVYLKRSGVIVDSIVLVRAGAARP